jgi:hypothetical protein
MYLKRGNGFTVAVELMQKKGWEKRMQGNLYTTRAEADGVGALGIASLYQHANLPCPM